MSGPSEKAVEAAARDRFERVETVSDDYDFPPAEFMRYQLREDVVPALEAAHDPALGLDRSVCLRDVIEWTRGQFWFPATPGRVAAAIQREFASRRT